MDIKGLIFDLDGVITNTAKLHFIAWRDTLKKYNISYSKSENDLLKGLSRQQTLMQILKNKNIKLDQNVFDKICHDKNDLYKSLLKTKLCKKDILPGILELLNQAKKLELKMAIASSSKNVYQILKLLEIDKYFNYVVDINKIKKGKPAPDIYLDAAFGLNLQPQQCIGFEDAFLGVLGLLEANINTVSITNGICQMYVYGAYICKTTKDLNLLNILHYFHGARKLLKEAIYHTAYGRYAYQNSTGDNLTVILRVKKNNVAYVNVRAGDPFNWKSENKKDQNVTQLGGDHTMYWVEETKIRMDKYLSDELFDYFKTKIKTKTKRIRYAFEIHGIDGSEILYGEHGFASPNSSIANLGFTWGYLNKGNVSFIPDWVCKTIWYQIFPDRFCNGDLKNDNQNTLAWNSQKPDPTSYFGGDLQGVINKLDYLCELGITGIYFTPIFKANTNHKYDTEDYLKIDPEFGNEAKLKELIDKAHSKNIKIMLDAVFNHCGTKFKPWMDVIKNKSHSKYKDWFFINDFKKLANADQYEQGYFQNENYVYETFAFTPYMPRLNWNNQDVKNYFKKVVEKWTKLGIDAWRLDVANEPSLNFWREFRKWVKNISNEKYILGEVWYNSSLYLNGDTFDGVMNYSLRDCIINAINNNWSKVKIEEEFSKYLLIYNNPIKRGMFNLLSSHDTARIFTILNRNISKFKLAYRILFHMLGCVCIYYGDEIGMEGNNDPDNRRCMIWDKKQWNLDLFKMFKKLIKMRKSYVQLTNGEMQFIQKYNKDELFENQENENIIAFKLFRKEKVLYCLVNFTNKKQTINLKNKKWYDIYYEKTIACKLVIDPYDMYTLKCID